MLIGFFPLFISTFATSFRDENRMQSLLTDIELDVQELKYLTDVISHEPNSPLKEVAKRSVLQMRSRLDTLLELLNEKDCVAKNTETYSQSEQEAILIVRDKSVVPEVIINEDSVIVPEGVASEGKSDSISRVISPMAKTILAEQIKPAGGLRQTMSLNDFFRFARELFHGDADRMNAVLQQLSSKKTLADALVYLSSELDAGADEEAAIDFTELLKKYFN